MELKDFISKSILDIHGAIDEANSQVLASARSRARGGGDERAAGPLGYALAGSGQDAGITFDIAVTISGTDTSGAGGDIKVAGLFGAGARGETQRSEEHVSRIQFKVWRARIQP